MREISGEIFSLIKKKAARLHYKYGNLCGMDADDIAQEISLRVLTQYDETKQDVRQFVNYIGKIVCVDKIRELRGRRVDTRRQFVEFPDGAEKIEAQGWPYEYSDTAISIGWIAGDDVRVKQVLTRYILDNATMAETATDIGVTEARICQIVSEIAGKIQKGNDMENSSLCDCDNCGRPDLQCQKYSDHGMLCASCRAAIRNRPREEHAAELAKVRERLTGRPLAKRQEPQEAAMADHKAEPARAEKPVVEEKHNGNGVITITFTGATIGIYDRLIAMAEREFRNPDQQALWLLKQATTE